MPKSSQAVAIVTPETGCGMPRSGPARIHDKGGRVQRSSFTLHNIISPFRQLRSCIIMIKTPHSSSMKVSGLFQDWVHSNNTPANRQKDVQRAAAEALSLTGSPPTNSKHCVSGNTALSFRCRVFFTWELAAPVAPVNFFEVGAVKWITAPCVKDVLAERDREGRAHFHKGPLTHFSEGGTNQPCPR